MPDCQMLNIPLYLIGDADAAAWHLYRSEVDRLQLQAISMFREAITLEDAERMYREEQEEGWVKVSDPAVLEAYRVWNSAQYAKFSRARRSPRRSRAYRARVR